jgi:hypothetical protein
VKPLVRSHRLVSLVCAVASALATCLLACNGLLGNRDATPEAGDAGAMGNAGMDGDSKHPIGDSAPAVDDASGPLGDSAPPRDATADLGAGDSATQDAAFDSFVCAPGDASSYTVLACDPLGPTAVAIDTANVYWIDGANVSGCSKTGCGGAPHVYQGSGGALTAIGAVTSPSYLYWADAVDGGSVAFCALPACAAPTTMGPLMAPQRIAFGGATAYWTVPQADAIDECAIGYDCTSTLPFATSGAPFALAVGGTNLYYTLGNDLAYCALSLCPTGGFFNQFPAAPDDVAADPSGLPVCVTLPSSSPMTGEVDCIFALNTSATPRKIIGGLADPRYVGLDSGYVYWIDDVTNALYRCPTGTPCTSPQLLATFPARPGTFAVDTYTIYGAVTGTNGFVYAVAKPP